MRGVTVNDKCYVCVGCGLLALTQRSDTLTCSPACRVRLHRHPELIAELKADAERYDVSVASILQAAAIDRLRPDLGDEILAGRRTIADVQGEVVHACTLAALRQAEQGDR